MSSAAPMRAVGPSGRRCRPESSWRATNGSALAPSGAMLFVVKRAFVLSASLSLTCVAAPALGQTTRVVFPPLPAAGQAGAVTGVMPTPQQLYEHVRRGVVAVERNGVPVAIGTVLGGDGRILTALSGLGGADSADVLYADGTTVHTKVGHSDKTSDLALLVPLSGKWTDGLTASETDPSRADVRAMLPLKGAHLSPAEAGIRDLSTRTHATASHCFACSTSTSRFPLSRAPPSWTPRAVWSGFSFVPARARLPR